MRLPLILATVAGCAGLAVLKAAPEVSGPRMLERIKALSSNAFEGRGPGTLGEEKTVAYLTEAFKKLGLEPGNPDGTYLQDVFVAGVTSKTSAEFQFADRTITPLWINDYIAISRRATPNVEVKDSGVIFCGYGVVAPEYGWDDFKGVDVRGKTIVVLVNDPPVRDPSDPTKLDDSMFKGKAMTYYGRWTYKYEEASEKGAAACLIVHETGPAGYPFAVVAASFGRENFDLKTPDANAGHVAVEGWLTWNAAQALFKGAGMDLNQLKAQAARPDFHPAPLPVKANFSIANTVRYVASKNVVAKVTGSDPKAADQYVIYSAHWDHLGMDTRLKGDPIFHGALDNASGTSALLEIAEVFASVPKAERPRRSLLFLAVTAEEKGLLGSAYYVHHPLYPLAKTLADFNMDGINVHGLTRDIQSVGLGSSTLDDVAADYAKEQGRFMVSELRPETGTYYRSDHFEFAKVGVPSCMMKGGSHYVGEPDGYGLELDQDYTANRYHKVTDVIQSDWTMDGAVQDVQTLIELGKRVANADTWPQWKPGNEFKARRDAMMAVKN